MCAGTRHAIRLAAHLHHGHGRRVRFDLGVPRWLCPKQPSINTTCCPVFFDQLLTVSLLSGPPVTAGSPTPEKHACGPDEQTKLKRKLSLVEEGVGAGVHDHDHDSNDASTKRLRQDAREKSPPASEQPPRQVSPPQRRRSSHDTSRQSRESAIQEEKKRGKRLFGGLLSTLSQTSTTSQHKRRQEIERRQQERLQKQREQDDQKRAEKLSKIREARLVEQVDFQEQVVRYFWILIPLQFRPV